MTKSTRNGSGPPLKSKVRYHVGYDYFTPDVGTHKEMTCLACGSKMTLDSCHHGPTGWAESMAKRGHFHDVFSCKFAGRKWHDQVIALKEYKIKCPSQVICDLIEAEIQQILKTKKHTKDVGFLW